MSTPGENPKIADKRSKGRRAHGERSWKGKPRAGIWENIRRTDLRNSLIFDFWTDHPTGTRRPEAFGEPLADPAVPSTPSKSFATERPETAKSGAESTPPSPQTVR